ncbi:polysaccharide biosynthesis protein [Bacillus sp. FJAT-29790]|uniref:putative polysaccharide biosynthesis protein n=1 Tax=Bacillus sp. FJAT-29790 TaxID=1895002 RepID=UPI001C250881|nr:polysaccharide biosynthesis protein [Bacillus sp. FJAT-29790]MBU8881409.1 polysaccharide biosynthesis protein [Bacillus sp. FJAT-29790]
MEREKHPGDLFKGAFILTIAALFIKILSAVYRVPFQNIVGDVGFYIYQQVYPFYGVALVLSTYGFPVVISKLYAEQVFLKGKNGIQNLFVVSAFILIILGFTGFAILFWGADWLAAQMDDPQLAILLRVVSIVFLLFPIVSLLRGYFQGKGNMVPTAVSQVFEQLFRVLTIFLAAWLLTKKGHSLYIVGGGAVFGAVTGGIVAVVILITFLWMKRKKTPLKICLDFKEGKKIAKALIIQGFAVCVSSLLLIFIQMADSLNLYSLLVTSGFNSLEAKELKGIYDRGQPLIQLGIVVATSMSLSLVPLITSEKATGKTEFLHDKIRVALQIGIFVGVAATVGLWNIIKPTNVMLFENSNGSAVLSVLSILILLSSVIITTTAVLQGLGLILFPAFVILCGFGMKYMMNILLVPMYGTMGAAVASCITLCLIMLILLFKLGLYLKISIMNIRFLAVICMAALFMAIALKTYLHLTGFLAGGGHDRLFAGFQALSAVLIGGFSYLWIVLKGNIFKEEELAMLPFGSKLSLLLPKKNRSWKIK